MSENAGGKPVIVQSGAGESYTAFGDTIQFKIGAANTGGEIVVGYVTVEPGGGPPPHIHRGEDELFLILDGRFSVFVNDVWTEVGSGAAVYTPRGNVHCFKNIGDVPGHFWLIVTPSGFEKFYEKAAAVFQAGGPPDMAKIMQLCGEYDMQLVGPPPEH